MAKIEEDEISNLLSFRRPLEVIRFLQQHSIVRASALEKYFVTRKKRMTKQHLFRILKRLEDAWIVKRVEKSHKEVYYHLSFVRDTAEEFRILRARFFEKNKGFKKKGVERWDEDEFKKHFDNLSKQDQLVFFDFTKLDDKPHEIVQKRTRKLMRELDKAEDIEEIRRTPPRKIISLMDITLYGFGESDYESSLEERRRLKIQGLLNSIQNNLGELHKEIGNNFLMVGRPYKS